MGMLQFATGFLGLSPRDFWRMTITEFVAGQKGWLRANGHEVDAPPQIDQKRYDELERKVAAMGL